MTTDPSKGLTPPANTKVANPEGRDLGQSIGGTHNKRDADSAERAELDRMPRDPKALGDPGTIPGATMIRSDTDDVPPVRKDHPSSKSENHDMLGRTIHIREEALDDDGNPRKGKYVEGSRCEAAVVHGVSDGGLQVEVLGRSGQERFKTLSPDAGKGWHDPKDDQRR